MTGAASVGLMLYTVRDECARDLEGVLRTVAGIGYDGVELFDLHGHEPALVRGWLDELGLVAVGRHAGLDALEHDLPALAAELGVLRTDRIALAWIAPPETAAEARAAVARIAAIAPRAQELGLRFGFHNHWGELRPFEDGVTTLDLLSALPPELLWFELDLGWVWEAGADPVALLERLAGRCPLVHVKDLRSRGSREHCPVGDGAVGYERVLPAALQAGVEWLIVEQDEVDGPPFEAVERSLQAVRRIVPVAA
ncbi:MAG TPA: sugar phosphate isomerase/epimerase [Gaiellaceae bacterium]